MRATLESELKELIANVGPDKFIQIILDEATPAKLRKWYEILGQGSPEERVKRSLMSVMTNLGCDIAEAKATVDATIQLHGPPQDTPVYVQHMLKTHSNLRANSFSTGDGAMRREKQYDRVERVANAMAELYGS